MAMLEAGGNAFDAVVSAGLVTHVVEPHMSGPGGEVVAVFATGTDGRARVLCGQGPAPLGATPAHFAGLGLDLVPGSGVSCAPVPGVFDAWMLLLRDYGTRTLRDVLDPAIGYADRGHPLLPITCVRLAQVEEIFRTRWPTSAALYLPTGRRPGPPSLHRNPALAHTLTRVLTEAEAAGRDRESQIEAARRVWSQGFVAEAIEEFAGVTHLDAGGQAYPGVITAADIARYQATYEEPARLDWRGWTVCKPGAWSQGPVLLQHLALLDGFGQVVDDIGSAEHIHTTVETAKLAFADREAFYGDTGEVPLAALLSAEYTAGRRRLVGEVASTRLHPGAPGGHQPRLPEAVRRAVPTTVDPRLIRADTCHIDVVDRFGNMIAATPSGGYFMTSPVIESLGFPLSNRLEMTWLEEGLPNTLRPGRRPRTTIGATLAMRDGSPALAFGTPGSDCSEQWSLSLFLAVNAGMDLQEALETPRWHTNHLVSSHHPHETHIGQVVVEDNIGDGVIASLRERGHDLVVQPAGWLGRMCAVGRDPQTGVLFAGADPRLDQAYAVGR
jgi:gamma-glutamyltranspeptidase/glutathione hydrolase